MRAPRSREFGKLRQVVMTVLAIFGSGSHLACAPNDEEGAGPEITYCDIEVVLVDKCLRCHEPGGEQETHVYWTSYDEVVAHERSIKVAVTSGSMPIDGKNPLTEAEEDLILSWLEDGAPAGDCE